jgi:transposase
MSKYQRLTDEQWAIWESLLSSESLSARGRPFLHDDRSALNGILWVLRAGAAWADLPERFPSSSTCYRRFSRWVKSGVFRKILEALARDLEERGAINLSECFIDGTLVVAKKGRKRGKDQAGQRYEAHGYCRRFWSSARRARIPPALMKSPL